MARKLKADTKIENGEDKPKRGRKAKTAANGSGSASAASNVPDEVIRKWTDKAIAADAEFQKAKEAMDSKRGEYRAILKEAAAAGCDKDAIVWLVKSRKREPSDIDYETRQRNRIARIMGLPIGTQLGLFDDGETVAAKVDKDALQKDGDAFEEGKAAGAAGRPADSNPYDRNSRDGIRWMQGYDDAQFAMREGLGRGNETQATAH